MTSSDDRPDRHLYLPSLEAAEIALANLPDDWRTDMDVEAVRNKLSAAIPVLRALN